MGKINWTDDQKKIIECRDKNILVSAAAGSGKTAVLVERIFQRIMDEKNPINVDQFVVVTFTRAAASEMKQRLRKRLEEALDENPDNRHLQRQIALLPKANISTVHSFCGFVIQNYFHRIGIDPSYRQGTDTEMVLMKKEVMDQLLEKEYEEQKEDFVSLVQMNCFNKGDADLEKMIQSVYYKAMSEPFPSEWLEQIEKYLFLTDEDNWENHPAVQELLKNCKYIGQNLKEEGERLRNICLSFRGPMKYMKCAEYLIDFGEKMSKEAHYDSLYPIFAGYKAPALTRLGKNDDYDEDLVAEFKEEWGHSKDLIKAYKEDYFFQDSENHRKDLEEMQKKLCCILRLTREFMEGFSQNKREKGVIDFNDLEQFAIQILLQWDEKEGRYVRTEAALELSKYFEEIMIDEYQDSNHIQETILSSVSRQDISHAYPNMFMVGDVKQSIYRFRNACPDLFGTKMNLYRTDSTSKNQLIDLHQNFRSREIVLKATNAVFDSIMHSDLGAIEYDEDARLVLGREFTEVDKRVADHVKVMIGYTDEDDDEKSEEENSEGGKGYAHKTSKKTSDNDTKKFELNDEGQMAVVQIQNLMSPDNPLYVEEKGELRPVEYRDIVILVRSTKKMGMPIMDALKDAHIPVVMEQSQGFFDAREIQIMTQMLQVMDNPLVDLPLAGVLMSPMFEFSRDEMVQLRVRNKDLTLFEAMEMYAVDDELYSKIQKVLNIVYRLREGIVYETSANIIQAIYDETGIYEKVMLMSNSPQRIANMDYLMELAREFDESSFQGIHQFVAYLEKIRKQEEEMGEVNLLGEDENVVRIMTIHKSKGLEFPVCILMGTGRGLKMAERNQVVVDSDLGISCKWTDEEKDIIKPMLYRNASIEKNKLDDLAEEIRILYVAMTRAKEQLIVTGITKKEPKGKASYLARRRMNTYLEMIQPAINRCPGLFEVQYVIPDDLILDSVDSLRKREELAEALNRFDTSIVYDEATKELLEEKISIEEEPELIPVKVSVSDIKETAIEELENDSMKVLDNNRDIEEPVPAFLLEEGETNNENKGASYGTIWHQAMAVIDFSHVGSKAEIEESIEKMVREGKFLQEDVSVLNMKRLITFFESPLGKEMRQAYVEGKLYREQPFVLQKEANKLLKDTKSDSMVLVQGIIDGFFEVDEGIVMMDYKTDAKITEEELINRYKIQMLIYRDAIESMTGKKVIRCDLYSFSMGKSVDCPLTE